MDEDEEGDRGRRREEARMQQYAEGGKSEKKYWEAVREEISTKGGRTHLNKDREVQIEKKKRRRTKR